MKRDDIASTSPFQLQVMNSRSTNKRILAQKTIFAAYHSVPPTEMGTWQVHQRCTHSDGSWWCFEPSHLEKSTRASLPNRADKHPCPGVPHAIYILRNRNPSKGSINRRPKSESISTSPDSSEPGSPAPAEGPQHGKQSPALADGRMGSVAWASEAGGQARHRPIPQLLPEEVRTGVVGGSTQPVSVMDPFAQLVMGLEHPHPQQQQQQQQHAFDFKGPWDLPSVSAAELLTGAEPTNFLLSEMTPVRSTAATPSGVDLDPDDTEALLDVFKGYA